MSGLEAQDRLILAMRFEDGRTVAEIAGILRLDQKGLYRRLERLLKELRKALQEQEIDAADVLEMLESAAVSVEWREQTEQGKHGTGPSIAKGAQEWR
jgi:RNA polymerase sigma factor for flagellar operon FliA